MGFLSGAFMDRSGRGAGRRRWRRAGGPEGRGRRHGFTIREFGFANYEFRMTTNARKSDRKKQPTFVSRW